MTKCGEFLTDKTALYLNEPGPGGRVEREEPAGARYRGNPPGAGTGRALNITATYLRKRISKEKCPAGAVYGAS